MFLVVKINYIDILYTEIIYTINIEMFKQIVDYIFVDIVLYIIKIVIKYKKKLTNIEI